MAKDALKAAANASIDALICFPFCPPLIASVKVVAVFADVDSLSTLSKPRLLGER